MVSHQNSDADKNNGHRRGHHSKREAGDDVGGGAGLRVSSDATSRRTGLRGIMLGHRANQNASDQTTGHRVGDTGPVVTHPTEGDAVSHQPPGQPEDRSDHQRSRRIHPLVQGALRVSPFTGFNEEGRNNGDQDPTGRQHHGEEERVHLVGCSCEGHARNDGADIGLKEIRAHSSDVTDVVTDVVRDNRRVSRVILRDTRFDFSDQVRTYVCSLGKDSAANTSEESNGRRTQREAADNRDNAVPVTSQNTRLIKANGQTGYAENPKANHAHSHDGSTRERHVQRRYQALTSRVGGTYIGRSGDAHPEISRQAGKKRSRQEGHGHQGTG